MLIVIASLYKIILQNELELWQEMFVYGDRIIVSPLEPRTKAALHGCMGITTPNLK